MLTFRAGTEKDVDIFFYWANDKISRENSYNPLPIEYANHVDWFTKRINAENFCFYVFLNDQEKEIGQVRIEKNNELLEAIISIVVGPDHRNKGYSSEMLLQATSDFISRNKGFKIIANIFKKNQASYKSFLKAGFSLIKEENIKNVPSYILCKQ